MRSNHAGAAGLYAQMAADAGLVGMYLAVANANGMPPWGGTNPLLGTNPIAIAVPTTGTPFVGDAVPVQLDLHGDGTLDSVYFDFVYAPMYDRAGAIEGIFVHAYDVTGQVRARQVAEAATRAQDEFLSIA